MSRRLAPVLLLATLACTSSAGELAEPPPSPAPTSPPPAFVEVEPEPAAPALTSGAQLSVVLPDGLHLDIRAMPEPTDHGWIVRFELEFHNAGTVGVFDLGHDPSVSLWVSIANGDGSGSGSAGGCTYSSHLHGSKTRALAPGERVVTTREWTKGLGARQKLGIGLRACDIRRPDGESIRGELARLEAAVDENEELLRFELLAGERPAASAP